MKTVISPRFTMLPEQWDSFIEGIAKYFLLPIAVTYLGTSLVNFNIDGFSWSDLVPSGAFVTGTFLLVQSQLISFTEKWVPKKVITTTTPDETLQNPLQEVTDTDSVVIDTTLLKG